MNVAILCVAMNQRFVVTAETMDMHVGSLVIRSIAVHGKSGEKRIPSMATNNYNQQSSGRWDADGSWEDAVQEQRESALK